MSGHNIPILAVALAVAAFALPATAGGLRASVEVANGMPRLCLNGRPTPPLIFFFNTDVGGDQRQGYLVRQVAEAAKAGIHLYSLPLRVPREADGVSADYAYPKRLLDRFIAVDPQAMFLVRVYPGIDQNWRTWKQLPDGEVATFADGTKGCISFASEFFRHSSDEDLIGMIRALENSPYGDRIFAYHPGGPNHENFHDSYREKGPDYCAANQRAFRQWLRGRYSTDEALRKAWARADVSLATATIPAFEPGRFPMHGGVVPTAVFYDLPREQDWVDFSAFSEDLVADRVIEWSKIVKRETGGRRLSASFYGYTMELPGSFSGHYALQRVLACPELDILAGPCSYVDRTPGDAGSFMSLVDTITAHGKLWFNEDDTRTNLIKPEDVPGWSLEGPLLSPITDTLAGTAWVLDRNLAAVLVHRAGTWWMDLFAGDAFDAPSLWDMMRDRKALYEQVYRAPTPFRPEVAAIVDENSKLYVKSDWDANAWTMYALRNEIAKVGTSVGYYSLQDFISGVVPPCRVYVFGNAFRLTDQQAAAIRARLDREKATAVWVYAPGYIGPAGMDASRTAKLVGMSIAIAPGVQSSEGAGLLAGEHWGVGLQIVPRMQITDSAVKVLGRYVTDHLISAAEVTSGRHRSIFLADIQVAAGVLRKLCESAGVHLWTRDGEIVQTDGRFLTIHAAQTGTWPIYLPPGVAASTIGGQIERREGAIVFARFERGETRWFRLSSTGPNAHATGD